MTDVRTKNETEKYTRYGKKTEQRKGRRKEKRQEKISKEENKPGIRGDTDAHRKASQGYHHGNNQQLIRAGAVLRLATLEAVASRL